MLVCVIKCTVLHSTVLFVVYSTAKRKVTVVYKLKLIIALLCIFVTQQMLIALLPIITVVIFYVNLQTK